MLLYTLENPSPNSVFITVTKAVTLDNSLTPASIVEKTSPVLLKAFMKEFTLRRNLMHVSIVEKTSVVLCIVIFMKECTWQKGIIYSSIVGKAFFSSSDLTIHEISHMKKSLMHVSIVEKFQ